MKIALKKIFFRAQKIIFLCLFFCFLFSVKNSSAKEKIFFQNENYGQKNIFSDTARLPNDSIHTTKKHKWIAAVLAFPIPFGVFGFHRWYLGSTKGMPLLYFSTFGGGFGTLPFIDFVVILIDNNMTRYTNNPKLFMWGKHKRK